jgi:hypothetical protein
MHDWALFLQVKAEDVNLIGASKMMSSVVMNIFRIAGI